jgi:hypothetical protein
VRKRIRSRTATGVSRLGAPRGGLPLLVGVALAAAAAIQGILGNEVAELLRVQSPVALVAVLAGLTILIALITAWQGKVGQREGQATVWAGIDSRNRARLLKLVQARAAGQLEQALHHVVPLELGLDPRPDTVDFPAERLVRTPDDHIDQPIPASQPILATFDQLAQAMLVLGTPGAGKTTLPPGSPGRRPSRYGWERS